MIPDPALETVREVRRQISRDVENDPARLVDRYRTMQAKFSGRLIPGPEGDDPQAGTEPPSTDPVPARRAAG